MYSYVFELNGRTMRGSVDLWKGTQRATGLKLLAAFILKVCEASNESLEVGFSVFQYSPRTGRNRDLQLTRRRIQERPQHWLNMMNVDVMIVCYGDVTAKLQKMFTLTQVESIGSKEPRVMTSNTWGISGTWPIGYPRLQKTFAGAKRVY